MYNRQLDTFLLAAEYLNFSKAAAALYITPSAVIQQINHLEQDLQVTLFIRTRHGLELTKAGQFLKEEATEYVRLGQKIRSELRQIDTRDNTICVGTSLFLKIRLVYDLWVLFSKKQKHYDIHLINIDENPSALPEADLIESMYTNKPELEKWDFLKICDVPLGCAVAKGHPLAVRDRLTIEDMKQYSVIFFQELVIDQQERLLAELKRLQIPIVDSEPYGGPLIWNCSYRQNILFAPTCMQDIFYDMVFLPCPWKFTVSYGIYSRPNASAPAKEFLAFVQDVYYGENVTDAVPVF
ncbi:MAG: LysR family transcriptional regulator [Lachnospiraceae bacterium]|nr:LysR family transcriptional regulator [Lachnospiraceae bacterium]